MWGGGTVTDKRRLENYISQLIYGPGLDPDSSNIIVLLKQLENLTINWTLANIKNDH